MCTIGVVFGRQQGCQVALCFQIFEPGYPLLMLILLSSADFITLFVLLILELTFTCYLLLDSSFTICLLLITYLNGLSLLIMPKNMLCQGGKLENLVGQLIFLFFVFFDFKLNWKLQLKIDLNIITWEANKLFQLLYWCFKHFNRNLNFCTQICNVLLKQYFFNIEGLLMKI